MTDTTMQQTFCDILSKADISTDGVSVAMLKACATASVKTGITEPDDKLLERAAPNWVTSKQRMSNCRLFCNPTVANAIVDIERQVDKKGRKATLPDGRKLKHARFERFLGLGKMLKDGGSLTDKTAVTKAVYSAAPAKGIADNAKLATAMADAACEKLRRSARDHGLDPKSEDAKSLAKNGAMRKVLQDAIVESVTAILAKKVNAVAVQLATGATADKPSEVETETEAETEAEADTASDWTPEGIEPSMWNMLSTKKQRKWLKKHGITQP